MELYGNFGIQISKIPSHSLALKNLFSQRQTYSNAQVNDLFYNFDLNMNFDKQFSQLKHSLCNNLDKPIKQLYRQKFKSQFYPIRQLGIFNGIFKSILQIGHKFLILSVHNYRKANNNYIYKSFDIEIVKKKQMSKGNAKDEEFIPDYQAIQKPYFYDKKMKRKQKNRKIAMLSRCQNINEGFWTPQQNAVYLEFLRQNRENFTCESSRRSTKIFCRLSQALPNRTSEQCRSHHKKIIYQIKSSDPDHIIAYLNQRMSIQKNKKTQLDKLNKIQQEGYQCIQKQRKHNFQIKIKVLDGAIDGW